MSAMRPRAASSDSDLAIGRGNAANGLVLDVDRSATPSWRAPAGLGGLPDDRRIIVVGD
jgi:hypothetical protein